MILPTNTKKGFLLLHLVVPISTLTNSSKCVYCPEDAKNCSKTVIMPVPFISPS